MTWTKSKISLVAGAAVVLAAGITAITLKVVAHLHEAAVWNQISRMIEERNFQMLKTLPAAVYIRPTKFPPEMTDASGEWGSGKMLGLSVPAPGVLGHAYNISRTRIVNPWLFPAGKYDYVSTGPRHQLEALQARIKEQFGLVAKKENRETNVLVLTVARPGAAGVKPNSVNPKRGADISRLVLSLEHGLKIPVVDHTDLANNYSVDFKWPGDRQNPDPDELKKALLDQLGLELTPDIQTIEMLVVQRAK